MKAPLPTGYKEMKQKAIDATRSSQIIQSMFGNQGDSRGSNRGNWHNALPQGRQAHQPFFQCPQQTMRGWTPPDPTTNRNSIRNWTPPVNSSNAPPMFNNQPIPMDLSRSRAPNRWGQQRGMAQGCVAQPPPPTPTTPSSKLAQLEHNPR